MPKTTPSDNGTALPETANLEPRDTLVETTRKQVRIPCGTTTAIVSGRPNFLITRSQAEALVAKGDVVIVK
jgi:hypothetical protein